MEQRIKVAIIGLAGLLLLSIIFILQVLGGKQTLERQIDRLNSENSQLRGSMETLSSEKRQLENGVNSLKGELDKTSRDKDELEKKFELVDKARKELIEKIKALEVKRSAVPRQAAAAFVPQTEDAYWAGILREKTDLEFQLESVRKELKSLQLNNEQLQREKSNLELDITALSRDKEELTHQMEYNQRLMDSLTADMVRERNEKMRVQEGIGGIKNDNEILRKQLKSLSGRKVSLERKLTELQEKNGGFENRFSEMEALLRGKVSQIENLRNQLDLAQKGIGGQAAQQQVKKDFVELAPIVVRPKQQLSGQEAQVLLSGKVMAVNRENNFVVIDLGEDAGVRAGDQFQVYHGDKVAAQIQAIQVRKSITACDIKKETSTIKVGDPIK